MIYSPSFFARLLAFLWLSDFFLVINNFSQLTSKVDCRIDRMADFHIAKLIILNVKIWKCYQSDLDKILLKNYLKAKYEILSETCNLNTNICIRNTKYFLLNVFKSRLQNSYLVFEILSFKIQTMPVINDPLGHTHSLSRLWFGLDFEK